MIVVNIIHMLVPHPIIVSTSIPLKLKLRSYIPLSSVNSSLSQTALVIHILAFINLMSGNFQCLSYNWYSMCRHQLKGNSIEI